VTGQAAAPRGPVMDAEAPVESMLANRRWLSRSKPFPHVVADNVFTADTYARLEASFRENLGRVLGHGYLEKHDIHGTTLLPADADAFSPLLSKGWHDLIAGVLNLRATGHVMCGIHHHAIGGAGGFPHNDLNAGWFDGDPAAGSIMLSSPYTVDYTSGRALAERAHPRETVRAAAALYYLANDPWSPGAGGETGLYRTSTDPVDRPATRVPPINNSLLAFECTPGSYHGFIGNKRSPRNSIIMWLHRPRADATSRWGDKSIVAYGLRPEPRPAARGPASDR
jgi:hypothetical protein